MPATLSGFTIFFCISEIEREEVLLANMAVSALMAASWLKMLTLASVFSTMASIKKSALQLFISLTNCNRSKITLLSSPVIFCSSTHDCKLFWMPAFALSSTSLLMSNKKVLKPLCAATCAMPLPMVPAPITQMEEMFCGMNVFGE